MTWIVILAASAAFGGVWWGMSRLGAHLFFVAALALLAALVVLESRAFLGIPL